MNEETAIEYKKVIAAAFVVSQKLNHEECAQFVSDLVDAGRDIKPFYEPPFCLSGSQPYPRAKDYLRSR